MSLIEGLDDSILFFLLLCLVNLFLVIYFTIVYFKSHLFGNENGDNLSATSGSTPPPNPHNPGMCPICMGDQQVLAVETSCAHMFCGDCLLQFWHRSRNISSLSCPMCRQTVNLLFTVFSLEEQASAELQPLRSEVTRFVRSYNHLRNASNATAILDRVRQVPILLRHLYNNLLSGQLDSYLIARMFMSFSISLIYLVLQTDVVPESFFGLLGLFDDILFFMMAIYYVAHVYRHFVGRADDYHADVPP